jgi:hypothetical protein
MSVKRLILEATRLIEKPENWTYKYLARDINDMHVGCWEYGACKFCMIGSLMRAAHNLNLWHLYEEASNIIFNVVGQSLPSFNDNNTHAVIIGKMEQATALAEMRGL